MPETVMLASLLASRPLPLVMGILNVTPDSFSDGGRLASVDAAVAAGTAMAAAGAAIVDVGGESTRPGATPVPEAEEIRRVEGVVAGLAAAGVTVSIDTRNASVMTRALDLGAAIVNDVSALTHDSRAAGIVAAARCPVVLMHAQGEPATMQDAPTYADVVAEVVASLAGRIAAAEAAGVDRARIIIDPGIGFGKTLDHNLALLRSLDALHALGCPLLLGASRKALISRLASPARPEERLGGSVALALHGAARGAAIVRVHDVAETVQALAVWRALA